MFISNRYINVPNYFYMKRINNFLAIILSVLPDKLFSQITFLSKHKRLPDLKNKIYFNEKLLYLKLNDRNKSYQQIVDKYQVRDYIIKKIGKEYLIPLVGVYDAPKTIDYSTLPNKFVIKITNGSQNNIVCTNKEQLDWKRTVKKINRWLKKNYYKRTREWPYKGVKNKILIEQFISDRNGQLNDYKFWCFAGIPKFVQIDMDRFNNHKRDFYDIDFEKKLPFKITYPTSNSKFSKPRNYGEMLGIVETLAKDFKFVRVDLYNLDGKIYFGELTFYPGNCNEPITPIKFEKSIGELLKL